jgi:branched-chain amino acid transport system ATP-binding protein
LRRRWPRMPTGEEVQEAAPILTADSLSKWFGAFRALHEVDLSIRKGMLHAVIGPNGAGKTTLFNVFTGQLRPSSGEVTFDGQEIHKLPVHRRAHLGMARSFQITSAFPELTVKENVRLGAQAVSRKISRSFLRPAGRYEEPLAITDEVLEKSGLARFSEVLAGNLSHGLSRRLEIAMALASRPQILLLDEPLSGMGIDDIAGMEAFLRSLVPEHTIVLVEHNMPVTLAIADRVTVLVDGEVLTEGTPRAVAEDPQVKDAYLGRGHT